MERKHEREIASTIIQLTIGPIKNFLSHIGTPCVSSYMAQSSYLVRNSTVSINKKPRSRELRGLFSGKAA